MVVLFVAAMDSDLFRPSDRPEHQTHFLEVGDLNVLGRNGLLMEQATLVLPRYFNVVSDLVKLVAVVQVHPFGVLRDHVHSLEKLHLAHLFVDALEFSHERLKSHLFDAEAILPKSLGEHALPLFYELLVVLSYFGVDEPF